MEQEVYYSHSVVPGGFDVKSYIIREIPGIFLISVTIFNTTCYKNRDYKWKSQDPWHVQLSKNLHVQFKIKIWSVSTITLLVYGMVSD